MRLGQMFPLLTNIRGEGLMLGFDLPTADAVLAFIEVARQQRLIVRG